MALEQLRGGDPGMASSREELSVLRGIAEELGLLGGPDAVRNFAAAFGVKQARAGGRTWVVSTLSTCVSLASRWRETYTCSVSLYVCLFCFFVT